MKRVNSPLSKWIGGAVTLCCTLLVSVAFSSCTAKLDELSANLTDRIDGLEKRIEKLEEDYAKQAETLQDLAALSQTVATLQETLEGVQTDVAANAQQIAKLAESLGNTTLTIGQIQDALKKLQAGTASIEETLAKFGMTIVACQYNETTGKYELMLSNGTLLELVANENAAEVLNVKKDTDGKLYWAVNGEYLTDASGAKVSVSVTPSIKIENNEVLVSVDGKTWHATGNYVEEKQEQILPLISNVDLDSDENNVIFTLADGSKFSLVRTTAGIEVSMSVNKVYVAAGETKQVEIKMKNVENYIIDEPDGWKVSLKDGMVSLTAPAEGAGESVGFVKIFMTSPDGKAYIHQFKVQVGNPGLVITINEENLTYDIVVDDKYTSDPDWLGYSYAVVELYDGMDLEDYYEYHTVYETTKWENGNIYKESVIGGSLTENFGELRLGSEYVVYATMIASKEEVHPEPWNPEYVEVKYTKEPFEDLYYVTYCKKGLEIEVSNISVNNADVVLNAYGYDGCYYDCSYIWGVTSMEEAQAEVAYNIEEFVYYAGDGRLDEKPNSFEGKLSDISDMAYRPGEYYAIMIVPADELSAENVKYEIIQMESYKLGETTANVTISDIQTQYDNVKAAITPTAGTTFYYAYVSAVRYAMLPTDKDKLDYIIDYNSGTPETEATNANNGNMSPGETVYLLVYAFDNAGVGKIVSQAMTTPTLSYSTASLTVTVQSEGATDAIIKVTSTAGLSALRYYWETASAWSHPLGYTDEEVDLSMAVGTYYDIEHISEISADNTYTISGLDFMEDFVLYVTGVDKQGNPTHMVKVNLSTKAAFMTNYTSNPVTLTIKDVLYDKNYSPWMENSEFIWNKMSGLTSADQLPGGSGYFTLDVDWSAANVDKVWILSGDYVDITGDTDSDIRNNTMNLIKTRSNSDPDISLKTSNSTYFRTYAGYDYENDLVIYDPAVLYVAVQTKDGKFHPYIKVVPEDYIAK